MAILITPETKIIVQGISGRIGQFHAQEMIETGTNVVGGVTPRSRRHHGAGQARVQHCARSC